MFEEVMNDTITSEEEVCEIIAKAIGFSADEVYKARNYELVDLYNGIALSRIESYAEYLEYYVLDNERNKSNATKTQK